MFAPSWNTMKLYFCPPRNHLEQPGTGLVQQLLSHTNEATLIDWFHFFVNQSSASNGVISLIFRYSAGGVCLSWNKLLSQSLALLSFWEVPLSFFVNLFVEKGPEAIMDLFFEAMCTGMFFFFFFYFFLIYSLRHCLFFIAYFFTSNLSLRSLFLNLGSRNAESARILFSNTL